MAKKFLLSGMQIDTSQGNLMDLLSIFHKEMIARGVGEKLGQTVRLSGEAKESPPKMATGNISDPGSWGSGSFFKGTKKVVESIICGGPLRAISPPRFSFC